MTFLRQTTFPRRFLIVICAHRGPALKLWYHTPKVTDFPHETVVGSMALTSTSALAAAGTNSKTATAPATLARYPRLQRDMTLEVTTALYRTRTTRHVRGGGDARGRVAPPERPGTRGQSGALDDEEQSTRAENPGRRESDRAAASHPAHSPRGISRLLLARGRPHRLRRDVVVERRQAARRTLSDRVRL